MFGELEVLRLQRARRRRGRQSPYPYRLRMGLPRLSALPFQRAVPITPANRTGARDDCLPVRDAFPKYTVGRRSHWTFRVLLRL